MHHQSLRHIGGQKVRIAHNSQVYSNVNESCSINFDRFTASRLMSLCDLVQPKWYCNVSSLNVHDVELSGVVRLHIIILLRSKRSIIVGGNFKLTKSDFFCSHHVM